MADLYARLFSGGTINLDKMESDDGLKLAVGVLSKFTPDLATAKKRLKVAIKEIDSKNALLDKLGESNLRLDANNRRYVEKVLNLKDALEKSKQLEAILLDERDKAKGVAESSQRNEVNAVAIAVEALQKAAMLEKRIVAMQQEKKEEEKKIFAKYRRTRRYRTKKEEKIIYGTNIARQAILEAHPEWDVDFMAERIKLKKDPSKKPSESALTPLVAEQSEFSATVDSKTWTEKKAKRKAELEAQESGSEASIGDGGQDGGEGGGQGGEGGVGGAVRLE